MGREKNTVAAMINIFCHDRHKTGDILCDECRELLDYAGKRLDKCPFQAGKSTCANCKVHCYKPSVRERIKEVMRYAGPRMMYRHPVLAALHFIDGLRTGPPPPPVLSKKAPPF
jgi:hypothetical protein